jgi:hypothetical protein
MVAPASSTPPAVDPARLEAHAKKLSIDSDPRSFEYGAKLEHAAAYIAEQFKAAGAQVSIQDHVFRDTSRRCVVAYDI